MLRRCPLNTALGYATSAEFEAAVEQDAEGWRQRLADYLDGVPVEYGVDRQKDGEAVIWPRLRANRGGLRDERVPQPDHEISR
jgi:hypothetical protein